MTTADIYPISIGDLVYTADAWKLTVVALLIGKPWTHDDRVTCKTHCTGHLVTLKPDQLYHDRAEAIEECKILFERRMMEYRNAVLNETDRFRELMERFQSML